jgi:hypothetical protein
MRADLRRAVVAAVPAWAVSRLLAVASLLATLALHGGHTPTAGGAPGAHGWWGWDAAWYRSIAEHGYAGSPPDGERFFPLFPLLGRGLGWVLGSHDGVALVVLANLFALAFGAAVVLLTRRHLGAEPAGRAGTLTLLAPGAVVLAMAYAEPLSGLLGALFLLSMGRPGGRDSSWWAVPIGLLAGLTRPTGFLLAVVPVVELWQDRRRPDRLRLLAAAAAPVMGAGAFCLWAWRVYGNPLAPFRAQERPGLRGGIVSDPIKAILFEPNHAGLPIPLRIVVVFAALALVVLVWRVLPRSIAVWASLLLLAALTSTRLTSLPRYISGDFPLWMALATKVRGRVAAAVIAGSSALFVAVAMTGFGAGTVL